ncbi:restriction endonuclease subunit S [uncultured Aquabacterium sp.]|uniref:restriction endonuclease subunit S n=1 Tax=uncultured Aquabacterium sp. TaxID=158753 RepID=UPI002636FF27|nr:restriction endonuclease subunit S [uncultured Aquabacterium sp.]
MSFPRYPAYKDSGVEWLGYVPSNWRRVRFKEVFREREERSIAGDETLLSVSAYTGVTPRSEILDDGDHLSRAESLEGYKVCYPNDLVMNIMLAWNRGLGMSPLHGICSPAYAVFQIVDGSSSRFLHYLLRSDEYIRYFKAFSAGVIDSRLRLYPDAFGSLSTYLPSYEEQQQIAGFLDRETAKIDALVAEQEQLITLLKEKRQAVISHAVTKGLDPSVPMKDSGVEWLGEVPAHWDVRQVRSVSSFITSGPRGWSERIADEGALFIQSGDLTESLGIDFGQAKRVAVQQDAETSRTRLLCGDVVVCITGAKTGNVAVAASVIEDAYVNQHLCLIRPTTDVLPHFLGVFLKSDAGQRYFAIAQYGLKQGLSLESIKAAPVAVPPVSEQAAIVAFVEKATTQVDQLIGEAVLSIELLRERRSVLISAAVTGQIDVRGLAPAQEQAA